MDPRLKHALHVIVFCSVIGLSELTTLHRERNQDQSTKPNPPNNIWVAVVFYILQYMVILTIPQLIFDFLGLTLFNAFPAKVEIKNQRNLPLKFFKLPHLCFRVVTRGLYPELVQRNVARNYATCVDSGLTNFTLEVVTDKEISLSLTDERIIQTVVPTSYRTSTGALFKARALQYALEDGVSRLSPGDYIVHLDEETILTRNVVNGIMNFALDGTHAFGQGLITYTRLGIVNWLTTLADSFRVADDMGKIRFQFKVFHKPLFGWKGSFVVTKYEAEKDVSFDHGPDGSIAEDNYLAMIAFKKGYTFDFIEGEMWEKSPFSIGDLMKQRKRWLQGILLVVLSSEVPIRNKLLLAISLLSWMTLPITTLGFVFAIFFPLPGSAVASHLGSLCFAISLYMYIFGVLKSFDVATSGYSMIFVYLIGQIFAIFLNLVIENVAVVWGVLSPKHNFYIVKKDLDQDVCLEA